MMAVSPISAQVVLIMTAAVLFYTALVDFKEFRIRNELIFVLAGLFIVHSVLSGRWTGAHWNVALAALMFIIMLYFYSRSWMGGGDVKILTVGFLWVGLDCALLFAILLMLFALLHVVAAHFEWAEVQKDGDRERIPFAPSVAAALIVCFMLGCLQPATLLTQLSRLDRAAYGCPQRLGYVLSSGGRASSGVRIAKRQPADLLVSSGADRVLGEPARSRSDRLVSSLRSRRLDHPPPPWA
jgi:Flp pilus assembly protein protease CpaA